LSSLDRAYGIISISISHFISIRS